MRRSISLACLLVAAPLAARHAAAQSVAQRLAAARGPVQVVFPSRPTACGDGQSYVSGVFGDVSNFVGDGGSFSGRDLARRCVHGPGRVLVTVIDGEITRLRTYVGPVPPSAIETIAADAKDAEAWLSSIVASETSRAAADAMLPLILVDGADPWPLLLRVARDDRRTARVRRESLTWLANGAIDRLSLERARDDTPDDEMRSEAVFVLSQRPKAESVPALIELARTATHPSARRSAIFWLGQTGDPRAADVFAELLGLR